MSPDFAARSRGVAPLASVPSPNVCCRWMIGLPELGVRIRAVLEQLLHDVRARKQADGFRVRPAVADRETVHVDGGIQRAHSARVDDVRIRAGVDQRRSELVVRIDDRDHERGRAVWIREIQVSAAGDQGLARFEGILPAV